MPLAEKLHFFVDLSRCIGCQSCIQACTECDTHKGQSMIQLDFVDRANSTQTAPVVCMHCESPTCAEVCPADAIKRTEDGIVQTARKPRCISCNNCVLACPFGVPKMNTEMNLMMKCDMCYDRTSVGLKPMCASVCPSQALAFTTLDEMARLRPNAKPVNTFKFGAQTIHTRVKVMVPADAPKETVDVTAAMYERTIGHDILDDVFGEGPVFGEEEA
ncbi:MAG: 4Fe-4S ferredoxin [Sandaracinaceae bacterium]|nr:4Fe-4S ferredoxin [Sandaracinaceae bacterium]